jgi:hypothetical protein
VIYAFVAFFDGIEHVKKYNQWHEAHKKCNKWHEAHKKYN